MKKKLYPALSLILAAAMLFSGCSSGGGTSSAGSAAGGKSSGETINYYSMWNQTEPQGQTLADAAKDFQTKTGITVKINFQGRDTRKTLQPALDSGQDIDLFDEDLDRVNTTWSKYLLNLEDLAKKSYDTTDGKPYTDVVDKKLIDVARALGPDGKLSTIPYQPSLLS